MGIFDETTLTQQEQEVVIRLHWSVLGYSEEHIAAGWSVLRATDGRYASEIKYENASPSSVEFLSEQLDEDERSWINSNVDTEE